jgi:hypothetical protein
MLMKISVNYSMYVLRKKLLYERITNAYKKGLLGSGTLLKKGN